MIGKWEQAEPGVKRKIFPPGDTIMMMEVHFEGGAEGYLHRHPHEQLTYVMKGSFEFSIEGEKTKVQAGETIFIPSNKEHGVVALQEGILIDSFTPVREDLLNKK